MQSLPLSAWPVLCPLWAVDSTALLLLELRSSPVHYLPMLALRKHEVLEPQVPLTALKLLNS